MSLIDTHAPGQQASEHTPANDRNATIAVTAFPLFIIAGSIVAFMKPTPFLPLVGYITPLLMIIMFCMGLTLTLPDFREVARRPWPILIGVVGQFVIMPLGAIVVAKLLGLSPQLAVGLLMLGSVPGGTASNVIAYLAKGDVALSVAMTSVSTVLSPIVTPMLMLYLASAETDVDAQGMAMMLVKTVLLPVFGGLVIRLVADSVVDKILPILPWMSIVAIGGVVFGAVAKNAEQLASVGLVVFAAVILHNVFGYFLGYLSARALKQPEAACRTTAIEVATQSAGLSSGMAAKFFSPEAALPGAVAAVIHNVTGAIYASMVRRKPLN